jgi:hypothetical protein
MKKVFLALLYFSLRTKKKKKMLRRGNYFSSSRQTFSRILGVSCVFSAAGTVATSASSSTSSAFSFNNSKSSSTNSSSSQMINQYRFCSSNANNNNNSSAESKKISETPKSSFSAAEIAQQVRKAHGLYEKAQFAFAVSNLIYKFIVFFTAMGLLYQVYKYYFKFYIDNQAKIAQANEKIAQVVQTTSEKVEIAKDITDRLVEHGKAHLPVLKEKAEAAKEIFQSEIAPEMKEKAAEVKDKMMLKMQEYLEKKKQNQEQGK